MGKQTIKPTTVRLEPQEREAIERIKELYGCPSFVLHLAVAQVRENFGCGGDTPGDQDGGTARAAPTYHAPKGTRLLSP
jgi:hypothetical protein